MHHPGICTLRSAPRWSWHLEVGGSADDIGLHQLVMGRGGMVSTRDDFSLPPPLPLCIFVCMAARYPPPLPTAH